MSRRRTIGLTTAVLLVLLVIGVLAALPEIVRRVAIDQAAKLTGRAVSLDKVELNLFTGRVALQRLRLAQKGSNDPALELEGLEIRLALTSLFGSHARVPSLIVTAPRLYVARRADSTFDFSDLLDLIPPADPNAKPSTRTVTIDRILLTRGAVTARDAVTSTEWKIADLSIEGAGLGTRSGPAGKVAMRLTLNGTPIVFDAGAIEVARGAVVAKVSVDGFDLTQIRPFIPASVGATPMAGRVFAALDLKVEKGTPTARVIVAGDTRVEGLALHLANAATPFVTIGKIAVSIKEAQPLARMIALDSITVDGVDAKVTRAKDGRIDLLALAGGAPAVPAGAASFNVSIREATVRGTRVTLHDETVGATLALTDASVVVRDAAWPAAGPLTFEVATGLPSAGKLSVKGSATLAPITAELTMSMRGAPIDPYQPYIPIPGRFAGTFNGESRSKVSFADGKLMLAVSQGKSWIDGLELRSPGAPPGSAPPVKVARVMIDGIDFSHPGKAAAKAITVTKPEIRIEREANGDINLRTLFAADTPEITTSRTPVTTAAVKPPPPPPAKPSPQDGPDGAIVLRTPLPVELGAFVIEDGFARFLDRSTKPAFSETVSKLAVRVDGLSSEPGRRAKLAIQAIVGGDSALDLKGEIAPFGDLYANVAGELRGFVLPTVNPYADTAIAWVIERGTLGVKLHYVIEKNQLIAKNEIIVDNLHVARSRAEDEVQRRIGLPLGLIVALVTDSNNGIRVNLPLTGSLQTWSVDASEAIWTAVKNVVVNVIASPFKAIGRMFTGGGGDKIESLAIDPAPFAAGSPTLAGEAEGHLTKVADFMRKSPGIKLTLAPVTTPADADSLREQALNARLQKVQREAKLETLDAAVAAEYTRLFPGQPPPKTTEECLARLREREPVPIEAVAQLATRRLTVVRDALAEKEGIPAVRLVAGDTATAAGGTGRVEFKIGQ